MNKEKIEKEITSMIAAEKIARKEGELEQADVLRGKTNMLVAMYWGGIGE